MYLSYQFRCVWLFRNRAQLLHSNSSNVIGLSVKSYHHIWLISRAHAYVHNHERQKHGGNGRASRMMSNKTGSCARSRNSQKENKSSRPLANIDSTPPRITREFNEHSLCGQHWRLSHTHTQNDAMSPLSALAKTVQYQQQNEQFALKNNR